MSDIVRRHIPELVSRRNLVGKAGTLRRSFPTGRDEFFRIYDSTPLHLEVEFLRELEQVSLVLHTNLGNHDGEWREVEFQRIGPRRFALDMGIEKCGFFRFKLRYSLDGGQTWFWDRVPFSEVLVDPAAARRLAMYTLIPTASGHIGQWKQHLQRIRAMGFNAVHLLPVTKMGDSESPYAAADLFAIDDSYLDPDDPRPGLDQFEDFVAAARAMGIRLCLDLVLNHVATTSTLVQSVPGWIVSDRSESDGFKRAGCWHHNQWITWSDLAKIDYDHPRRTVKADIWNYMTEYAQFWAGYAAQTGGMIRFDNLHSSHEAFVTHCTRALRRAFPSIVCLAEFFSDQRTLEHRVPDWGVNLLLANSWEYKFVPQLREYLTYLHDASGKLHYFVPITTHDTGTPTQEFGHPDATIARAFVMALFCTGQTGSVQGVEYGAPSKVEFIGRQQPQLLGDDAPYAGSLARINELMLSREAFTNGGNLRFVDRDHDAILGAIRLGGRWGESDVLILANLDIHHEHAIDVDLAAVMGKAPRLLNDLFGDEHVTPDGDHARFTLKPSGVRALELLQD